MRSDCIIDGLGYTALDPQAFETALHNITLTRINMAHMRNIYSCKWGHRVCLSLSGYVHYGPYRATLVNAQEDLLLVKAQEGARVKARVLR